MLIPLLAAVSCRATPSRTLSDSLSAWSATLAEAGRFQVTEQGSRSFSSATVTDVAAVDQERRARIKRLEGLDAEAAARYVNDRVASIRSLFETQPAPYPGVITREIHCPERFLPQLSRQDNDARALTYFEIYATPRLSYGACADDLVRYRAILAFARCRAHPAVFEIEIFVPIPDFDAKRYRAMIESFAC